jgi:hypothetical protein
VAFTTCAGAWSIHFGLAQQLVCTLREPPEITTGNRITTRNTLLPICYHKTAGRRDMYWDENNTLANWQRNSSWEWSVGEWPFLQQLRFVCTSETGHPNQT